MQPIGQATPNLFSDTCPKPFINGNLFLPAFLKVFPLPLTGVYKSLVTDSKGLQDLLWNLLLHKVLKSWCMLNIAYSYQCSDWVLTTQKDVNSFSLGFLSWVTVSNHQLIFLFTQFINMVIKAYSPGFWNLLCEISNYFDLNSRKTFKSLFPHQRNSFKFQV